MAVLGSYTRKVHVCGSIHRTHAQVGARAGNWREIHGCSYVTIRATSGLACTVKVMFTTREVSNETDQKKKEKIN